MLGSGTICDSVQTEHLDWTIAALALKYQNTKIPKYPFLGLNQIIAIMS